MVILIGGFAMGQTLIDLRLMRAQVEALAHEAALQDMNQLQGVLEFALERKAMAQVRQVVSAEAADPSVLLLVATDHEDNIIASTLARQMGVPLSAAAGGYAEIREKLPALVEHARRQHLGRVERLPGGKALLAVYPLTLALQPLELRPSRTGALVLYRDLRPAQAAGRLWAVRSSLLMAGAAAVMAVLAMAFAHYALNRRVKKLVTAACLFAEGDLHARAELPGSDEISTIATAFDAMAERVAETQRNLQHESERLHLGAAHASDVLYEWNVDDGSMEWFGAVGKPFGARPGELGRTLAAHHELVHPDDRPRVVAAIERHLEGGIPYHEVYRVLCMGGTWRVWEDKGSAVKDAAGRPIRFFGAATDVTERERAEENRKREMVFTDACINGLPGIFYILNLAGSLVRWNRNLVDVSGFSDLELARMHPLGFFDETEHGAVTECLRATFAGCSATLETVCRTKEGRLIPYFFTGHQFIVDGETFIVGVGIDLTERKQAEAARAQLEVQLVRAQKLEAIGMVAGGIAHDFNNILTIVLGNTELIQLDFPEDHPAQEMLSEIAAAGERGRALVREIITFGRRRVAPLEPVSIEAFLANAARMLQGAFPAMIAVRVSCASGLPPLRADSTQLGQMIMNLGQNAGHAMAGTGGVLELKAAAVQIAEPFSNALGILPPGRYVRIEVRDTGPGMAADVLERIFDPFFTTKAPGVGTGLGLAVVLGVVRGLCGGIRVESTIGVGTAFEILLPSADTATDPGKVIPRTPRRALLVDDEAGVLYVGQKALERSGWQVTVCQQAAEALRIFEADPPAWNLVITDRNMPGMSGFELLTRILQSRPEVPVVLCTGFNNQTNREQVEALGIRHVLLKPYPPSGLVEMAERAASDV